MTLDERQQHLLDHGLARIFHGRLIPIMRGGSTDGGDGGSGGEGGDGGSGGQGGDGGSGGQGSGNLFTPEQQVHVDRIVQERLSRVKNQPPADYEELKKAKAELDKLKADQLSDIEKANEARAAAERERDQATERAQRSLTDAAIIGAAAGKLADPTDAIALIDRASIEFDSDGSPTNVGDLVKSLVESKPHLAAKTTTNADLGARGGGGEGQLTRDQLKGMSADEISKALSDGKLSNVLGGK